MVYVSFTYYFMVTAVWNVLKDTNVESAAIMKVVRRFMAYPVIMFLCFIFPTINRIDNSVDPRHPKIALYILHVVGLNLNGLLNSVVYGFNDNMQKEFRQLCCREAAPDDLHGDGAENDVHSKDKTRQETEFKNLSLNDDESEDALFMGPPTAVDRVSPTCYLYPLGSPASAAVP